MTVEIQIYEKPLQRTTLILLALIAEEHPQSPALEGALFG